MPTPNIQQQADTLLTKTGRSPARFSGYVNPPIYRGSTILAESLEAWENSQQGDNPYGNYGRFGSPTISAFEQAIAELEGGFRTRVFPSGLSACTHTLLAILEQGDHILITDNVYGPTRAFADEVLPRFGILVEYFDPTCGDKIREQIRPNTRVVYLESPGSQSFEIADIPLISAIAHKAGALVVIDNSWATPLCFKALEHGADISIQAATKYILGHSDALLGTITSNVHAWETLQRRLPHFGETAGPEDVYLALRGLRTLGVRLRQQAQTGIALAETIARHPMASCVLHPALPDNPGYSLWCRDFTGASGLFSFILASQDHSVVTAFFGALKHFGIGLSWGGYESLALPVGKPHRTISPWPHEGCLIRLHAGLEDPQDLISDIGNALDAAAIANRASSSASPHYAQIQGSTETLRT